MSGIQIGPIDETTEIVSPELKSQVEACSKTKTPKSVAERFLARNAKEELGLLCTARRGDTFYINRIYVFPRHRNAGIGTILLRWAEEHAREFKCVRAGGEPKALESLVDQARLVAWYERYGYRIREGKCLMKNLT